MMEQILLSVLGFVLGITATLLTQLIIRRFSFDNAKRKLILGQINVLRDRLSDYEKLFKCNYPELYEFVFSHDALNSHTPYFSNENPQKVYNAFVQYQAIRKVIDEKERLTDEALDFLDRNKLIRKQKYSRQLKFYEMGLHSSVLLGNYKNTMFDKLGLLRSCDYIIFNEFPKKVATFIEWDRLGTITPSQVGQIIHTRLRSRYQDNGQRDNGIAEAQCEKEADLGESRENLVQYRNRAFQLIQEIGLELSKLEQKWIPPS